MPTLFKILGYIIYFWSGDGSEPPHVHIGKGMPRKNDTKVWVGDRIELEHNKSQIPQKDLVKLLKFIAQNRFFILAAWDKHFGRK